MCFFEDGLMITILIYYRKIIVNPAFAKRSVPAISNTNGIAIKHMHEKQKNSCFLRNLDYDTIDFHRKGRKDFYSKLEGFLNA